MKCPYRGSDTPIRSIRRVDGYMIDAADRIILDLCGGTGAWSKPYKDAGYDVRQITLPEYDVRLYEPPDNVYGVLAAPPCTNLARSGARLWKSKGESALLEAMSIVDACLRIITVTNPEWWALENPIGRIYKYLGEPLLKFDPYYYGDPYTKRTWVWGKFNIPIENRVEPVQGDRTSSIGPTKSAFDRSARRSITPSGFAQAFCVANSLGDTKLSAKYCLIARNRIRKEIGNG